MSDDGNKEKRRSFEGVLPVKWVYEEGKLPSAVCGYCEHPLQVVRHQVIGEIGGTRITVWYHCDCEMWRTK